VQAIHLSVPRVAVLVSLAALLATVAVLAVAAGLRDVSFGGSGGGGQPAPITVTGSASLRSLFAGSPFAIPFRVTLPWKPPVG
jgi:hypothetical protein